jgi:hypothetical protein
MKKILEQGWNGMIRLCRAEPDELAGWLEPGNGRLSLCLVLLILGSGVYGFSVGLWRDPLLGVYVGLKFPLIVLVTALGNAVINGMLAQLLGTGLSFRQSFTAVMISFALLAVLLGSLTPLSLFLLHNTPPMGSAGTPVAHNVLLLFHVALIAAAGLGANIRFFTFLRQVCGGGQKAIQVLGAWLLLNMIVGCQVSWNMRPFVGSPGLPVRFLREHPFDGSFYENIFKVLLNQIF